MTTDGDDERQWRAKLSETANTLMDRKLILDALDKCLRAKQERHTDLASAVALVGTCPDMCPEQERYFRIETNCVSPFENDEHGRPDQTRMVKEYRRSGADQKEPLPHELRPISVLQRSMTYLCLEIVDADYLPSGANLGEWFDFIWSRTRSIRKDITQQHLISLDSVNLIEKCARFHIYCAYYLCEEELKNFDPKINDENLRNCLQTLKEFYFELGTRSIYCPNEAEFRSYDVVLNLQNGETLSEMKHYRKEIRHSPDVRFAVKIYQAFQSKNPIKFFQLARKANFFMSCILNIYFTPFRIDILNVVRRAYTVPKSSSVVAFPLDRIMHLLAFDELNEMTKFCDLVDLEYDEVNELVNIQRSVAITASTNTIKRSIHLVQVKLSTSPGRAILSDNSQLQILPIHSSFDANNRLVYDLSTNKPENQLFSSETFNQAFQQTTPFNGRLEPLAKKSPVQIFSEQQPALSDDSEQFFADADDVEAWMLDFRRLVSSNDVGVDEATTQSLIMKHNNSCGELKNYYNIIEGLKQQADTLWSNFRRPPEVVERISRIGNMYNQLIDAANSRKQALQNTFVQYRLGRVADSVDQWVEEKERLLSSMTVGRDLEEIAAMKDRFDAFEEELSSIEPKIKFVNDFANKLQNFQRVVSRKNDVNEKWDKLKARAEQKKAEINAAYEVQTFHDECLETVSQIEEKTRLLQSTDEADNDHLPARERDLSAISSQVDSLQRKAQVIQNRHPRAARVVGDRVTQMSTAFNQLDGLIKALVAKLGGDLQRFLRDLEHLQTWLKSTMTAVASEDTPKSLAEAEKLLSQHQRIKEEIDNFTAEFNSLMEYGEKLTQDKTDPKHIFLFERLKALRDGWSRLHKMWANRRQLLSKNLDLQRFLRDAKQVELLLNQQEIYLEKDEVPANLEQAESAIRRHEEFMEKLIASEDAVIAVLQFADRLKSDNHFHAEKIAEKADYIQEWYEFNMEMAKQYWSKLQDQYKLQQFLTNCDELNEWIQAKYGSVLDETYSAGAKTVHSRWIRHLAFGAEVATTKDCLHQIAQKGKELAAEKPEMEPLVDARLAELEEQLEELQRVTRERGQRLQLQVLANQDLEALKRTQYLKEKYFRLWLQKVRSSRRHFIRAQFPAAPVAAFRRSTSPVASSSNRSTSSSASFTSASSSTFPFRQQFTNGSPACFTVIDPQIRTATASIRQSLLKKLNCDYATTVKLAKRKLAEREEQRCGGSSNGGPSLDDDPFREVHTFHPDSAHLEPIKKRYITSASASVFSTSPPPPPPTHAL
ncbi:Spectrin beta chain, non-erythrocytic 1 [Tyrophagus putrescentiae]|nr:Spectrin beta chain, non-erythrocytic 1 [Tyrophagus putrescentiae]